MSLNTPLCSQDDLKKIKFTQIKEFEKKEMAKENERIKWEQKINSSITQTEKQLKSISNLQNQLNECKQNIISLGNDIKILKNNPENQKTLIEINELKEVKQKLIERIKLLEKKIKKIDTEQLLLELEEHKNSLKNLNTEQKQILNSINQLNIQVKQILQTQQKTQKILQNFQSELDIIKTEISNPNNDGYFTDPEKLLKRPVFQRTAFSSLNLEDNYLVFKTLFDTNTNGFDKNLFRRHLESQFCKTNLIAFYKFGTKFVMKRLFLNCDDTEINKIDYGLMKEMHRSVIDIECFISDLEFNSNGSVKFLVHENSRVHHSIDERKLIDFLQNQTIPERICLFLLETKSKYNSKDQTLTEYFNQLKKNEFRFIGNQICDEIAYPKKAQLAKYIISSDSFFGKKFIFVARTQNGEWKTIENISVIDNDSLENPIETVFVFESKRYILFFILILIVFSSFIIFYK
ncbi:hypothetical protein EDI_350040 [Entamoeba dispar SAW760]|uniref:Uncharacterized protein n=1 Tax=Entamoeba dispar (strain ATCC PRA-260 / SAW760) TaxID=370354 RepID=B0EAK7_ENTDS|nr:uncharacterized protein EDI_350040 [Entamoeba dispar SAW760]EDR28430.1 hypothetical protein EDI_350040 [Entamoeba dispar SAW760]|eukprot:EDR28430.1 hypothetical protein EDI_350040 [Entamoeba dispar SAW760]